jgi:hypothetical protein
MAKTHRRRHGLKRTTRRKTRGGYCFTQRCKETKYRAARERAEKVIEDGQKKVKEIELLARRQSAKIKYDLDMVKKQTKHALARTSHA